MVGFLLLPAAVIIAALLTEPSDPPVRDTIILLPDEDGSVGSLIVSSAAGQQSMDTAYSTVSADDSGSLSTGTTTAAEVQSEFGALLAATPVAPRSFIVTFESGSADTLSDASQRELATIRNYLTSMSAPEIVVIGHTDRVGSEEDNDKLSRQRAETVANLIQSAGIEATRVQATGRGEREPLIETADGIAEPRNRRVEIRVR